jgi:protein-tyrosine phosphatase
MKIQFVCYGNICRSPMAEALFRRALEERRLVTIDAFSSGIGASPGNCPPPEVQLVMQSDYGLDLSEHRSQLWLPTTDADLTLALDGTTLNTIRRRGARAPNDLLGSYAGTQENVHDPYGGNIESYRECARKIDELVRLVVERICQEMFQIG